MYRYNPTLKRLEVYDLDGRLIGVYPPAALTDAERQAGAGVIQLPPEDRATVDDYLTGNTARAVEVDDLIRGENRALGEALQQQAATPGDTSSGTVGLLPSAEELNARLNIAQTALSAQDAYEKLGLAERKLRDAARRAGFAVPDDLYGGAGPQMPGFAEAQGALSELAARDPAYLGVINRLGGMPVAAEINRRENVLAEWGRRLSEHSTDREQAVTARGLERRLRNSQTDATEDLGAFDAEAPYASLGMTGPATGPGNIMKKLDALYTERQQQRDTLARRQQRTQRGAREDLEDWQALHPAAAPAFALGGEFELGNLPPGTVLGTGQTTPAPLDDSPPSSPSTTTPAAAPAPTTPARPGGGGVSRPVGTALSDPGLDALAAEEQATAQRFQAAIRLAHERLRQAQVDFKREMTARQQRLGGARQRADQEHADIEQRFQSERQRLQAQLLALGEQQRAAVARNPFVSLAAQGLEAPSLAASSYAAPVRPSVNVGTAPAPDFTTPAPQLSAPPPLPAPAAAAGVRR